jgi:hypothetical protein
VPVERSLAIFWALRQKFTAGGEALRCRKRGFRVRQGENIGDTRQGGGDADATAGRNDEVIITFDSLINLPFRVAIYVILQASSCLFNRKIGFCL